MVKGILLGIGLAISSGVLVVGAVNRTMAKTGGQWPWSEETRSENRQESGEPERGQGWANQDLLPAGFPARAFAEGAYAVESAVEAARWMTIEGAVREVGGETLQVKLDDGSSLLVEGRAWRFALEEGFRAQVGDRLTLVGFLEGEEFAAGGIHNLTSGAGVLLRDDAGRPLWSGKGKGGGS